MDKINILVYCRPANKQFYKKLARGVFPESKMIIISEFRGVGDIWLGKNCRNDESCSWIKEKDFEEIIMRCRFLRNISGKEANLLIKQKTTFLNFLFEKYKPNMVIGTVIDNYTTDILERIASKNDTLYIAIAGHMFSGYFRITKRGELNLSRSKIENFEINRVLTEVLNDNYIPSFHKSINNTLINARKFFYREMLKKYLIFFIFKIIHRDKWNYHYRSYYFKENNCRDIKKFVDKSIEDFFLFKDDIKYSGTEVFVPLHYIPEATTDYWCEDPMFGKDYEKMILNIIKRTDPEILLIVKEHPQMYMKRNRRFYEKLSCFKNVILIHPSESSRAILQKVDTVCVCTGSVGVEALLRNKRVIALTSNYYSNLHPNIILSNDILKEHLNKEIVKYSNEKFIEDLLQGLLIGEFLNNKKIMKSDIDQIIEQITKYMKGMDESNEKN